MASTRTWTTTRRRRQLRIVLALISGLVCLFFWGCGTPERRYKILSFFFDGVPDPNALVDETKNSGAPKLGPVVSRHKPYLDKNCDACHGTTDGGSKTLAPTALVCRQCHAKVLDEYPLMHGPVVTESCLWCHNPHQSTFDHLLRAADRSLCTVCHDRQTLLGPNPPEHQDEKRSCLDCHVGHGSTSRYMLREPEKLEKDDSVSSPVPPVSKDTS